MKRKEKKFDVKYYAVKRYGSPWGGDTVILPLYEVTFSLSDIDKENLEKLKGMNANEIGKHCNLPPLPPCRGGRYPWNASMQSGGYLKREGIIEYANGRLMPEFADSVRLAIQKGIRVLKYSVAKEWQED